MLPVEITMHATDTHASAHHKYIGLDSSTFPHPRRDDPPPRVYYGDHSACSTHALWSHCHSVRLTVRFTVSLTVRFTVSLTVRFTVRLTARLPERVQVPFRRCR